MNWPQICNENIFCKDNSMDQDIFNQFLITEPSDSKPLVPDLVPAWKDSCPSLQLPPLQAHAGRVPMWPKPAGAGKISRSFLIPNTGL